MSWRPGKSPIANWESNPAIGLAIKKPLAMGVLDAPNWPGLPRVRYSRVITPFLGLRKRRTQPTGKNLPKRRGAFRIED